jgi:hypothetical protein
MFLCRIAEDGRRQIQTNLIHSLKKLSFYVRIASDHKISDNSQVKHSLKKREKAFKFDNFVVLWGKE